MRYILFAILVCQVVVGQRRFDLPSAGQHEVQMAVDNQGFLEMSVNGSGWQRLKQCVPAEFAAQFGAKLEPWDLPISDRHFRLPLAEPEFAHDVHTCDRGENCRWTYLWGTGADIVQPKWNRDWGGQFGQADDILQTPLPKLKSPAYLECTDWSDPSTCKWSDGSSLPKR